MAAKTRAAAILIENGRIAMIERRMTIGETVDDSWEDEHNEWIFYVFPGGHVDNGELPEQGVAREVHEELGLLVSVKQLVARSTYRGRQHFYYLVERTGGVFGAGHGKELSRSPHSPRGSVTPVWIKLDQFANLTVYPAVLVEYIIQAERDGWPETIFEFQEPDD